MRSAGELVDPEDGLPLPNVDLVEERCHAPRRHARSPHHLRDFQPVQFRKEIAQRHALVFASIRRVADDCLRPSPLHLAAMASGERFAYVDVLSNPEIRATLPGYANWPTFPQLYVDGELVGGCDIITEMYQSGELEPLVKGAGQATKEAGENAE